MPDNKKMIELNEYAGDNVDVILRIPIKNRKYIEYQRTYSAKKLSLENDTDRGTIKDEEFVFALFPNIKFEKSTDAYYRFGLIVEHFDTIRNYDVKYAHSNGKTNCVIRNNNVQNHKQCKNFILENSNFDYIRITCATGFSGIVVPVFFKQGGTDQYTFAIDFGTTNTHIEYSLSNSPAKPFDIRKDDKQLHLLSQRENIDDTINYIYDFDFIPETIGKQNEFESPEFEFPIRTALSEATNTDWKSGVFPIGQANVAFPYEKRIEYRYNRIQTGLKWSNEKDIINKIRCYIESLFLILRNKVILNNGSLSETKIVWFYPISMTRHRFNLFKDVWDNAYLKYFGDNLQNIIPVTESVAPYEYYKSIKSNVSNVVSIDIGGETSDIVIADDSTVKHVTSFRFAANSIFGDGYAKIDYNGIIRQFKSEFESILKSTELSELKEIYEKICNEKVSRDIASFFFSLKNNKKIIEKNLQSNVDFSNMLRTDDKQKIIFVFFYAAIIYHLAHIMKAQNLKMPRHITFSGNGSKVVQILTTDTKLLENYTKLIFEKIYGTSYDKNGLTILQSNKPKEATCKGGIYAPKAQDYEQLASTKVILDSSNNQSFVVNETYGSIDCEKHLHETVEEVKKFIQFVIDLNSEISYKDNFGINSESFLIAKETCFIDLEDYAKKGLSQKRKEVSDEDPIEETFFFYPINGMLNALSISIYNELNQ
jgi:hypothetical protein